MPPSPCTGSTRIAAVSGVIAAFSSFRLPKVTWSKPSTTGSKPFRYFSLPAAASVAKVRPWNEPLQPMTR